jgi:hypothetical protein
MYYVSDAPRYISTRMSRTLSTISSAPFTTLHTGSDDFGPRKLWSGSLICEPRPLEMLTLYTHFAVQVAQYLLTVDGSGNEFNATKVHKHLRMIGGLNCTTHTVKVSDAQHSPTNAIDFSYCVIVGL